MLKKLNSKLILIQSTFLFLLVTGMKRLYIASYSDVYEAIIAEDFDKLELLTDLSIGEFITNQVLWPFGFFLVGVLLIGLINWRYKASILNSSLTFIIVFPLFPLGLFSRGYVSSSFNSFCYLFAEKMETAFYIGGTVLTLIAVALLWLTVRLYRKSMYIKT